MELITITTNVKIVIQIVENAKNLIQQFLQIVKHVNMKINFYILVIVQKNVQEVLIIMKVLIKIYVNVNYLNVTHVQEKVQIKNYVQNVKMDIIQYMMIYII